MSAWTMTAPKQKAGGDFEKAPAGNHPAVLVAIIDMGTQEVEGFQGAPSKMQHRAYFVWELVGERAGNGKNHLIAIDLNVSFNEKAKLRKWVELRKGSPIKEDEVYDLSKELGQPCLLNVVNTPKGYPKVEGVSAVPKGLPIPPATYKPFSSRLDDYKAAGKISLPDWVPWLYGKHLSDVIKECKELEGVSLAAVSAGDSGPAATPAAPTATTGTVPPPPRRPAPQAAYYLETGNPDVPNDVPVTLARIKEMYQTVALDWTQTQACKVGSEEWVPFFEALPEMKAAVPF